MGNVFVHAIFSARRYARYFFAMITLPDIFFLEWGMVSELCTMFFFNVVFLHKIFFFG